MAHRLDEHLVDPCAVRSLEALRRREGEDLFPRGGDELAEGAVDLGAAFDHLEPHRRGLPRAARDLGPFLKEHLPDRVERLKLSLLFVRDHVEDVLESACGVPSGAVQRHFDQAAGLESLKRAICLHPVHTARPRDVSCSRGASPSEVHEHERLVSTQADPLHGLRRLGDLHPWTRWLSRRISNVVTSSVTKALREHPIGTSRCDESCVNPSRPESRRETAPSTAEACPLQSRNPYRRAHASGGKCLSRPAVSSRTIPGFEPWTRSPWRSARERSSDCLGPTAQGRRPASGSSPASRVRPEDKRPCAESTCGPNRTKCASGWGCARPDGTGGPGGGPSFSGATTSSKARRSSIGTRSSTAVGSSHWAARAS